MEVTISKWGNSLGLRIPALIVKEMDLQAGDRLAYTVANKNATFRKLEDNDTSKFTFVKVISKELKENGLPKEIFSGYALQGYDEDYYYCSEGFSGSFEVLNQPRLIKFSRSEYDVKLD